MLITCSIRGVTPLLHNRFTETQQPGGSGPVHHGQKPLPREQAQAKLYVGSDGKPVLPGVNLFRAIIDAGVFIKSGKSKLTTMKSSLVPAGAQIAEIELPITPGAWEVDSRSVVIPSTGGRIMAHRPRFDDWKVTFSLQVDDSMFSDSLMRELVDMAGQRIGVGDFRPSRKGPFGRFRVERWSKK